jgi:hypothetical protein
MAVLACALKDRRDILGKRNCGCRGLLSLDYRHPLRQGSSGEQYEDPSPRKMAERPCGPRHLCLLDERKVIPRLEIAAIPSTLRLPVRVKQ